MLQVEESKRVSKVTHRLGMVIFFFFFKSHGRFFPVLWVYSQVYFPSKETNACVLAPRGTVFVHAVTRTAQRIHAVHGVAWVPQSDPHQEIREAPSVKSLPQ